MVFLTRLCNYNCINLEISIKRRSLVIKKISSLYFKLPMKNTGGSRGSRAIVTSQQSDNGILRR